MRRLTAREHGDTHALCAGAVLREDSSDSGETRPVTIRNAIYGIQNKLGIETKQGLVVWAVRNGLLDDYQIGR